ncbi:MAG: carbohydrate binding family 9 domain-containing protein, partial [Myxococcales bacterium]|nr:carbohydrate binding family 9 domain-containing protein [Myxococcales bacterium]
MISPRNNLRHPTRGSRAGARTCVLLLLALVVLLLPAGPARADEPVEPDAGEPREVPSHDRRGLRLQASRIDEQGLKIDGKLDEPQWAGVPMLPELIQQAPVFGAAATHPTEIRAAYGDEGLYFAFFCHEHHGDVIAPFFQRDQLVPSDLVQVEIDSNGDDTTGYVFGVSPSGAIFDGQLFRDIEQELLWDGVFSAAATEVEGGWTAEIFVPWSTLRFVQRETNTIGLNFSRVVNDQQEVARLSFVPQGVPARVSEAIDWAGIRDIAGGLSLEIQPYVSGRFALQRPEGSLDQSWRALPNAGFDLKYGITGDLTLDLAVNPDFGQAEVDAAVLNLGPFEVYFPEKRRFFLESKEIFETPFPLFYSRRVGAAPNPGNARLDRRVVRGEEEQAELVALDPLSRVLGSVRLTGQPAPGWVIGVLSAVTGPTWGRERFSDGQEQRIEVDPLSSWSVIRLRRHFDPQTWVGGIVTNVARGGAGAEAVTGGFDYNINFRKRWIHNAQVIATHDGLRSGMGGTTAINRSGRRASFFLGGQFLSPHANYSDLGYLTATNYAGGSTGVAVYNAQPVGKLRELSLSVSTDLAASFSGELTEKSLSTNYALETLGLWRVSTFFGGHLPQLDLFETRGNIPYEVPLHWWTGIRFNTPRNRRVAVNLGGNYGEQNGRPGPDLEATLFVRPIDRLQLSLNGQWHGSFDRPRWVAERE